MIIGERRQRYAWAFYPAVVDQAVDMHNDQVGKYLAAGIGIRMPAIPGKRLTAEKSLARSVIVKKAVGIFYQGSKGIIGGIQMHVGIFVDKIF